MKLSQFILVLSVFVWIAMVCTQRPTPTQVQSLNRSEESAQAAEAELKSLEERISQLESELSQSTQTLEANQLELKVLQSHLNK